MEKCIDRDVGQLLIHYENGILDEEGRAAFEEHLMQCDSCLSELVEKQPLSAAFRSQRLAIAEVLRARGADLDAPRPRRLALMPAVAVGAALIASLVVWLWRTGPSPNPYLVYLSFEKPAVQTDLFRGPDDAVAEALYAEAVAAYAKDDYASAVARLNSALLRQPDNGRWWLQLGICHYLQRKPGPAIGALQRADTSTQFSNQIEARWYLAQAHVLDRHPERAMPLLAWVVSQGRAHTSEASELIAGLTSVAPPHEPR